MLDCPSRLPTEDEPADVAPPVSKPVLVSVPEAARRLGIGVSKLKELVAEGEIRSVKIGRRRLFRPRHLEAYADELDQAAV